MGGTLSEADSTALLSEFGVPFAEQRVVPDAGEAARAAAAIERAVVESKSRRVRPRPQLGRRVIAFS